MAATIGIVAWPPQVTMLTFISPCRRALQVHRRHAEGADGGGGEVDHQHAQFVELAAVLGMHVGAGGVEGDLHAVGQHVGQQAVHALGGGLDAHLAGTLEAVGFGVDAHHPHRLQHRAALASSLAFASRSVPMLPGPIRAHLILVGSGRAARC
jgi:hypothetical protein